MLDPTAANDLVAAVAPIPMLNPWGEGEEFNLFNRMMTHAVYVGLGIAGAYVTQGAEGVEMDLDEPRRPFDRTLPPPRDYGDDADDDWPWDD